MTVSCERSSDPIYDIIEPLDYFPVYPGSWWKYTINDTLISIDSVSKEYQLHSYQTSPEGYSDANGKLVREFSDPVYVPFFNSRPIYGYEKIEWVRPPFGDYYMKWPILTETAGFNFERNWEDKRYGDFTEKVEVRQKIFNGSDSVLILEGHWIYGPNVKNKSYQEYFKGIGLYNEYVIDTTTNDTVYKKLLTDWFINK